MKHYSQYYVDWLNDIDVYKYLETGGNYTLGMLHEYLKEVEAKDIYFWGIHLKSDNRHIGNIKIDPVNVRHGFAEYGIMMGCKSEWGKGYAREASLKILDFCFQGLNLRKINLGVVIENTSAYKLYKNIGFEVEGIYKEHGLYQGKYCDIARMAIFNKQLRINEK